MNIRTRLTFLFIALVALILSVSSLAIYFFSADHRKADFYTRLFSKATNTAKLLIEVDEIDAELLARIEKNSPASLPNERIIIYNFRNEILYSSDPEKVIKVDDDLLNTVRLQGDVRYEQKPYEVLGILYKGRYDRFVVIAAAADIFGHRRIKNLGNILAVTFITSVVLVSVSGWIYSGRALRPISKVINQVDNITETNLNVRLDVGKETDEITRLAITFNRMLDRIEKAFAAQKNFIANASHELRTPLTTLTGKLEVMLLQRRSSDEYELALQQLLAETKNLNKLSNRLLLLAQASGDGWTQFSSAVRIDEVLWQAKDDLLGSNPKYVINIHFDLNLDDELLTITGDEQLIKAAVINLMENGCKYSPDQQVDVVVKAANNELVLMFSDQGIGIPEEEFEPIFEPFYRAKNALAISGHGIGLSLVSRVIKLHHGKIDISSALNKGSVFTVLFPLKSA